MAPIDPVVPAPVKSSAAPTNKWWAAQVVAAGALATMYFTTGGWDTEESVAAVGLVVGAATTYLIPNDSTPGGVPVKGV